MSRDGVGIRRVMGELDRLSADNPSLQRYARLACATYHALHGDSVSAKTTAGDLLDVEPRSFNGWIVMMGVAVRLFASLGEHQRARAIGERVLALLDADDRQAPNVVVPVITELALIEAQYGEPAAAQRIDEYLAEIGERGGPLALGTLHEARAQVALMEGDILRAGKHLAYVNAGSCRPRIRCYCALRAAAA